jgi:excisionase family DNA binding protein
MTTRVTVDKTTPQSFIGREATPTISVEELIEVAVERAIRRSLGPHLRHLRSPQPAVYTVAQSAEILQVSGDTIGRMVRRGVLPRVPHVGGKVLIPRRALDRFIDGSDLAQTTPASEEITGSATEAPRINRSINSAAS